MKRYLIALAVLPSLAIRPAAAERGEVARETLASVGDAVIAIEIVSEMKMNYGGREQTHEQKLEALGIVIGAKGEVVTALSSVDPTKLYENMSRPGQELDFSANIKSMKYIMADNTEIAARIVLRDSDLDMAFLVPETVTETPFTFIDLENDAEPQLLSGAFTVARMGRIARRTPTLMSGEVQGIVSKPRPFYIPSAELVSAGTGVPVFSDEGALFGVVLLHSQPSYSADDYSEERVIPVVIPAADIRAAAAQIPADGED